MGAATRGCPAAGYTVQLLQNALPKFPAKKDLIRDRVLAVEIFEEQPCGYSFHIHPDMPDFPPGMIFLGQQIVDHHGLLSKPSALKHLLILQYLFAEGRHGVKHSVGYGAGNLLS